MAAFLVLLLLPALVYAEIQVEIAGSNYGNKADFNVKISGEDVSVIDDTERSTFRLNDAELKQAVQAYFGERPTDAYLRSPTPWGDLYKYYKWNQVIRTLRPISAQVLSMSSETRTLDEFFATNNSSSIQFTISHNITDYSLHKIKSSWKKSGDLKVGQETSYKIAIEPFFSLMFNSPWGQDNQKIQNITYVHPNYVLQPGESKVLQIRGTTRHVKIKVEYEASLFGQTAVNYAGSNKDHYFWALNIRAVMDAAGLPRNIRASEIIELQFMTDVKLSANECDSACRGANSHMHFHYNM